MEWTRQWKAQGMQEGIEKGREEGREEGRKHGEAAMLIKMLELKFGPLPSWAQERIAQADSTAIEHWAANLLKVETLEAVFQAEP